MRKRYYLGKKQLAIIFVIWLMALFFPQPEFAYQQKAISKREAAQGTTTDPIKLYVSVWGKNGDPISTLNYFDFSIVCDKVPQQVSYFSKKDEPVSIVFLIDTSGSMKLNGPRGNLMRLLPAPLSNFVNKSNRLNEYSIVCFGTPSSLIFGWANKGDELEKGLSSLGAINPSGGTSIFDAVDVALEVAKSGGFAKRAIILFSDGKNSLSKLSPIDLKHKFEENTALFYSIDVNGLGPVLKDSAINSLAQLDSRDVLSDLAAMTGGTAFFPRTEDDLSFSFSKISDELKYQYVVGFNPNCNHKDTKPHRIQVKLAQQSALAADSKKISIRHRVEYQPSLALNKK